MSFQAWPPGGQHIQLCPPHLRNRNRLVELWNAFGLYISLSETEWAELEPVLHRLSVLDIRVAPRIDRTLAEAAIARHFAAEGQGPRRIRWFPDAFSARAYKPSLSFRARHAFPSTEAPTAFAAAWYADDAFKQTHPEHWAVERLRIRQELKQEGLHTCMRDEIATRTGLLELFAAGCFYYSIESDEVICVARPSLWVESWKLHREHGPAVQWSTGEQYFFWRGVRVPRWVIENPEDLSPENIRLEPSISCRYAMIDRFGRDRYDASALPRDRIVQYGNDWKACNSVADFQAMARHGIEQILDKVSQRLLACAQASMDRFTSDDMQRPSIDRTAVEHALRRFFSECNEPMRPVRWFEDGHSARTYIAARGPSLARAAYWPKLPIARQFDAAWYTSASNRILDPNLPWLEAAEDWIDWSIVVPRARDCHDSKVIQTRAARLEHWRWVRGNGNTHQHTHRPQELADLSDAAAAHWTPLIDAFAAGLFYYWIGTDEIVCIPRPLLWLEDGRLHRANGPAVSWPTGESYYFLRGIEVPAWLIEQPEVLTLHKIRQETNAEVRRCMVEIFGYQRFVREGAARLVAEDSCGKLWEPDEGMHSTHLLLEVTNGTTEPDGTRRIYFLRVPPEMTTPREAVAWTYGLTAEQYDVAVRT